MFFKDPYVARRMQKGEPKDIPLYWNKERNSWCSDINCATRFSDDLVYSGDLPADYDAIVMYRNPSFVVITHERIDKFAA